MTNPLISIILPTYNVYPYLAQCLDSIIAQTYKNIEVIIVIDGATDGSYELAKEYSRKDSRFRVYWQGNAGSGSARNNGLGYATGEYVIFIDPDDWVKEDYVEQLYMAQCEGDYDLVTTVCENYYYSKNNELIRKTITNIKEEIIVGKENVRNKYAYLHKLGLIGAPTKKIYKMDVIRNNNISFPDMRRSQDIVFNYRYYDCISSVRIFDYYGYCYRIVFSQRLARLKSDYYKTIVFLYNETKEIHEKWGVSHNMPQIATIYTNVLSGAIESNVVNRQPIDMVMEDVTLREMVGLSAPKSIAAKLFKILFQSRSEFLMTLMMRIKYNIKIHRLE